MLAGFVQVSFVSTTTILFKLVFFFSPKLWLYLSTIIVINMKMILFFLVIQLIVLFMCVWSLVCRRKSCRLFKDTYFCSFFLNVIENLPLNKPGKTMKQNSTTNIKQFSVEYLHIAFHAVGFCVLSSILSLINDQRT